MILKGWSRWSRVAKFICASARARREKKNRKEIFLIFFKKVGPNGPSKQNQQVVPRFAWTKPWTRLDQNHYLLNLWGKMMDQKAHVIARIAKKLAAPSCPVSCLDEIEPGEKKMMVAKVAEEGQKNGDFEMKKPLFDQKTPVVVSLSARLAAIDPRHRAAIEELLAIESNYPFRAFVTEDGLRAGIICGPSAKALHWEQFRQFSRLFFGPSHEVICEVFAPELANTARLYKMQSSLPEEVEVYGDDGGEGQQIAGGGGEDVSGGAAAHGREKRGV